MSDIRPIAHADAAYHYPLLIKHILRTPLQNTPDQEIVYRDKVRYSYRTLNDRIAQLANALSDLGIGPGDTVAMMDWDSHRYLECYFAVPMMGAVLMTANPRLSPEQILYTLNHSEADILIINHDFLPILAGIRDRLETVRRFVLIDEDGAAALPEGFAGAYEALVGAAAKAYDFPDFDENARATTFYTTGTTGDPKGVYFSHRQLMLHTMSTGLGLAGSEAQGRFHRGDVYMPITPMFHVHAWGIPYVATMFGVKQVYPGRYTPEGLIELIRNEHVTFSHCVPTILNMILNCPAAAAADFGGWKIVIGGSALSRGLAEAAMARGIDVFTGYGMSETCPILTLAQVEGSDTEGSETAAVRTRTGRTVPLVDLKAVDEEMQDATRDGRATGEIVVRAPWCTQGYFKNAAASENLWAGGYLHTGDIGTIDPAGYVQVTDRIKDVIKTGGEWISSLALEDLISRHPGVREVAVIGVPDPKWGERPLALIVPNGTAPADADAIRAHLAAFERQGTISKFAIPERILCVDEIEKTSVGKLNKKKLRERYASG